MDLRLAALDKAELVGCSRDEFRRAPRHKPASRARLAAQAQGAALRAFEQPLMLALPDPPLMLGGGCMLFAIERPEDVIVGQKTAPEWSSTIASGLPSAGRSTRPIIWRNKPIFLVDRARMAQPISGMSKPSVSTMQLVTTLVSPDSSRARIAARSSSGGGTVQVLGADAGADKFVADVDRMADAAGERHGAAALAKLEPMRDDIPDQLLAIHALGKL